MSKQNIALITGVTGQDGSYLAELLLDKGTYFLRIMCIYRTVFYYFSSFASTFDVKCVSKN